MDETKEYRNYQFVYHFMYTKLKDMCMGLVMVITD